MSEEEREHISEEQEDIGINLFEYLIVLLKRKKLIILITLPVAIISIIISILSSISFYQADTSIFVSQEKKTSRASQLLDQLGLTAAGSENIYSNEKLLVEIMKSRTFTHKIIDLFNLKGSYGAKDYDEARKIFFGRFKIVPDFTDSTQFRSSRLNQSPLMRIIIKDNNAKKAAEIANAIVEELTVYVNNIALSKASRQRLFFAKHLKLASDALINAEEDMQAFQEKTGILFVGEKLNIPVDKFTPKLILEYKRIFRDLKFNETMYEIMVKQYESAKIEESKNAASIQIIDKAVPPLKPRQMRTWGGRYAVTATLLAFLFSCFLALALEYYKRPSEEHSTMFKKS